MQVLALQSSRMGDLHQISWAFHQTDAWQSSRKLSRLKTCAKNNLFITSLEGVNEEEASYALSPIHVCICIYTHYYFYTHPYTHKIHVII